MQRKKATKNFKGFPLKSRNPVFILKSTIKFCVEVFTGGDKGIRTPDLLNAIQALSQLSYIPNMWTTAWIIRNYSAKCQAYTLLEILSIFTVGGKKVGSLYTSIIQ